MKNLVFLILLLPALAFGSPVLVSDPSTDGAEVWQVEVDGTLSGINTGDVVNFDLVDITPGSHIIKARFGINWTADGDTVYEWSEWSAPFPLERPARPGIPGGMRLSVE